MSDASAARVLPLDTEPVWLDELHDHAWLVRNLPCIPPATGAFRFVECVCIEDRPYGPYPGCDRCDGTGFVEVPQEPIEQEDLPE